MDYGLILAVTMVCSIKYLQENVSGSLKDDPGFLHVGKINISQTKDFGPLGHPAAPAWLSAGGGFGVDGLTGLSFPRNGASGTAA